MRRNQPGPYQLQAAITAVHTDGPATDWTQVLALYDQLLRRSLTPIVALNRAVAVAEVHGPAPALAAVENLDLPERTAGFERDGWATGHFDSQAMAFVDQVYQRADAFLFGRWTYDSFADYRGVMEPGSGPIADALNTRPKYVASNTLTEPRRADTTVLSGDVAAAIADLKAKPGGELRVHGSGNLIRRLLDNQLGDEITVLVGPVVVGQGARLFPDSGPDIALDLVE